MPKLSATVPLIHPGCLILDAAFGAFCEVGASSRVMLSTFNDYAYCDRMADIANTTVRRFADIAAMTRIGPTDHPFTHAAQHHFLYRSAYYRDDATDDPAFFTARRTTLGPDCWIGHGAIVASGAVVTRDVDRFMIVAGCPAKPLRPRITPAVIDTLATEAQATRAARAAKAAATRVERFSLLRGEDP